MKPSILILAAAGLALASAVPGRAQTAPGESKPHEYACIAATVGGTVAGIAIGSLLGGGVGTLLFEGAGGELGGKAGHMLKCPGK